MTVLKPSKVRARLAAAPRTIGYLAAIGALATWAHAARADIGFTNPDGITDGLAVLHTDIVNLQFYGILDIGYGYLKHSYPGSPLFASTVNPYNLNGSPHSFSGFYNGGISMNRVGIQGDKNLGPDLFGIDVYFKVESAINPIYGQLSNNGQSIINDIPGLTKANGASAIDGQMFSRVAYAGISKVNFGSLEFGRTTDFSLDQVAEYDPVQNALLFSPLGFSGGIGGGLGATENTRYDNSIKYQNRLYNIDFGIMYRFHTSSVNQDAESGYVAMLGYTYGPFSVEGTLSQTFNTVAYATQYSNVVAPDPNLQIENTRGFMVSGKYVFNVLDRDGALKIGYENSTVTAPSNLNLTNIRSYYGMTLPNNAVNATGKQTFGTFWFGGDYKIFKSLDVAAGYYNIDTYNTPEVHKEYRSNILSLLIDYTTPVKGLDVYFGTMYLKFDGPGLTKHSPNNAYPDNVMTGGGVRIRF
jgi:predicted porin